MNAVQNTFLSYFNSIAIQVLVLAGVIILTRILDPEDYGIWAMVAALQAMMQPFFTMGLRPAFIKKEVVNDEFRYAFFTTNVGVSVCIAIIFFVMGFVFATIFNRPIYIGIAALQSVSALLFGFTLQRFDSLYRDKNFMGVLKIKTSATIISLVAGITLAIAGFGVWALAIKLFVENLIQFIVARFVHPFKYKLVSLEKIRMIEKDIRFGLQLTFGRLMNGVAGSLDKYMMSGMASTETLGQYDRSFMLNSKAYQTSYTPFNAVILPYIARVKDKQLSATYDFVFFGALVFTILPCLLFIINAKALILLLFGAKWQMASVLGPLLGFWLIGKVFEGFTEMTLTNEYKGKTIIKQKIVYIAILLIGSMAVYFLKREAQFYVLLFSTFSFSFWLIVFTFRIYSIKNNIKAVMLLLLKLVALFLIAFLYHQQYDSYFSIDSLILGVVLKSIGLLFLVVPFILLSFRKDTIQLYKFVKARLIKPKS